jgi:hypothetical protein
MRARRPAELVGEPCHAASVRTEPMRAIRAPGSRRLAAAFTYVGNTGRMMRDTTGGRAVDAMCPRSIDGEGLLTARAYLGDATRGAPRSGGEHGKLSVHRSLLCSGAMPQGVSSTAAVFLRHLYTTLAACAANLAGKGVVPRANPVEC